MAKRQREPGELGRLIDQWRDGQFTRPSSAAIARAIDVSRTTVSEWEAGTRRPEPENLERLARLLHLPYEVLLYAADRDDRAQQHQTVDIAHGRPDIVVYAGGKLVAAIEVKRVGDRTIPAGRIDVAQDDRWVADALAEALEGGDEKGLDLALTILERYTAARSALRDQDDDPPPGDDSGPTHLIDEQAAAEAAARHAQQAEAGRQRPRA